MVSHIVLFQLKEELGAEERKEIIANFKKGIEVLPATIPFIRHISVGANVNPEEKWDICLTSAFDSLEDVKAYAVHPAHIAVAQYIRPFVAGRACVDSEQL